MPSAAGMPSALLPTAPLVRAPPGSLCRGGPGVVRARPPLGLPKVTGLSVLNRRRFRHDARLPALNLASQDADSMQERRAREAPVRRPTSLDSVEVRTSA